MPELGEGGAPANPANGGTVSEGAAVRIDTQQIAKRLEVSVQTARRMCERGDLKTARRKTPDRERSPWTAERAEVEALSGSGRASR